MSQQCLANVAQYTDPDNLHSIQLFTIVIYCFYKELFISA